MASWVTHLMIADEVMKRIAIPDRHGFCVGNIAPDCNIENADWSDFTPPKKVTHWMNGARKAMTDVDAFCDQYIIHSKVKIESDEQFSFLLGYYVHLITDATIQEFVRNEERVCHVWDRIKKNEELMEKAKGLPEDWDTVKKIIPRWVRDQLANDIEAEYLKEHPDSGYLTEVLPLKDFPDYIDYLPHGCIVRKIGIMGYTPVMSETPVDETGMTKAEYMQNVENTVEIIIQKYKEKKLIVS